MRNRIDIVEEAVLQKSRATWGEEAVHQDGLQLEVLLDIRAQNEVIVETLREIVTQLKAPKEK